MKKLIGILFILVLLAGAAGGFIYSRKESFAGHKLTQGISSLTGTDVVLAGLHVKMFPEGKINSAKVSVEKIKIMNPPGFKIPVMAVLTDFQMELDPWAALRGAVKAESASGVLKKAAILYSADGKFNLEKIKALHEPSVGQAKDFYVKRLELKIGQIWYADDRGKPAQERFAFNDQLEVYNHAVSPELWVQTPVLRFLEKANKGSMGFARGKIQESIAQNTGKPAE